MGGKTGEIQIVGSARELIYKYVNHQAGTTKASTRIVLFIVQMMMMMMYNIFSFRLLIGVPDHSTVQYSESSREVHKMIIVTIVRWEVVTFLRTYVSSYIRMWPTRLFYEGYNNSEMCTFLLFFYIR